MDKKRFKVGDTVLVPEPFGAGHRKGTVIKVGRVWGYAQPDGTKATHSTVQFDLNTGRERQQYGGSGLVYTPQEFAEREERQDLLDRLHLAGLEFRYYGQGLESCSNARLRRIVEAAESGD